MRGPDIVMLPDGIPDHTHFANLTAVKSALRSIRADVAAERIVHGEDLRVIAFYTSELTDLLFECDAFSPPTGIARELALVSIDLFLEEMEING